MTNHAALKYRREGMKKQGRINYSYGYAGGKSVCCGAPVRVEGTVTMYHVCTACNNPCDVWDIAEYIKNWKPKTNHRSKIGYMVGNLKSRERRKR